MNRISCLALPVLLVAACGDFAGSKPDAPAADAAPVVKKQDGAVHDAPAKLDAYVGIDLPDAPESVIDTAPRIDVPAVAVDGPGNGLDTGKTDAWLVTSPDGRVFTVVDACLVGPLPSNSSWCPTTYAEGLAKVQSSFDASPSPSYSHTGAGRCSEGTYVYAPTMDTSALGCYYDAGTQQLVSVVTYSDTMYPCGQGDTISFAFVSGARLLCTDIAWEAYR